MKNETDIKDCNSARIELGDWGKDDPETKLQQCADTARSDSRCGDYFFFRANKGRCFCEVAGNTCERYQDLSFNEYRLLHGL